MQGLFIDMMCSAQDSFDSDQFARVHLFVVSVPDFGSVSVHAEVSNSDGTFHVRALGIDDPVGVKVSLI